VSEVRLSAELPRARFVRGDTVEVRLTFEDAGGAPLPTTGYVWALLVKADRTGAVILQVAGVASGSQVDFTLDAADTATLLDVCTWQVEAVDASARRRTFGPALFAAVGRAEADLPSGSGGGLLGTITLRFVADPDLTSHSATVRYVGLATGGGGGGGGGPHASTHVPTGSDPLPTGPANTLAVGDTAGTGTSTSFARSDHRHAVPAGSPAALATSGAGADGTATSFSRSDHRHAIPATLDTNARVRVRVNGLDVGVRRAINLLAGSGVTISGADDAGSEEVDVTLSATGGGGGADGTIIIDVFTASGTWSKPADAQWLNVWLVGAGGGGGGGRIGSNTTNRCGGGGGSGGQLLHFAGPAGAFASSVPVTVGAGGTGGPGGTGTNNNGGNGGDGGTSSFGSITAQGGAGGAGGTNSTSVAGGMGRVGLSPFALLIANNAGNGTNSSGANSLSYAPLIPPGGGGGAGRNNSDVAGTAGGNGAGTGIISGTTTTLPGFGVDATVGPTGVGDSGANGTNPTLPWPGSGGAGGMCGDATTPGGNGGNGGRAAGGGGGGATTNGAGNAGNGGNGGDGYCVVITWTGV